ncbi:hypothetical protein F5X99DRAFT_406282 [Biscogniauxia marginata]|nr:hypothetical protein F5X99DRAFT_406282 [Biscogniauxia marginata]
MPSPGSATRNLCVDDVLAFDDAELVEYMKKSHGPDGGFALEFDGWEKLPKGQRDRLAARLRIGAQKVNDVVQSRPVDPDQLAARLHGVADNQDAVPQALFRRSRYYRTPTLEEDGDVEKKRSETIAYNTLVSDGCRPVYPISRLEEVFNGLEEYDEMLRPWQDYPGEPHKVFRVRLYRWKLFRRWQQDNREPDEEKEFAAYLEEQKRQDTEGTELRPTPSQYVEQLRDSFERRQHHYGLDDGDEEFAAYIEEKKQDNFQDGCKWPGITEDEYMKMLGNEFKKKQAKDGIGDGDEGFAAFVEEEKRAEMESGRTWPGMTEDEYIQMRRLRFDQEQSRHYWLEFYWLREDRGRGGFSEYVAEAKRRLARHGFTKAFEFDKDPTRQDKLTTWIEYLNYEYSWLDRHTRMFTRLQPDYDKGWQRLVDSGVLRRGETAAGFCTIESSFRRQGERDAAEKAVEDAKTAAMAVLDKAMNDPLSNLAKTVRIRMMEEARSRLEAARASLRTVMRRCDLITEFVPGASDYEATEKKISLQRIRLEWVLEQVPLVEAELKEAEAAENSLGARGRTKRKLGDDQNDEGDLSSSTQAKASKRSRLVEEGNKQSSKRLRSNRQMSKIQQVSGSVDNISTGNLQPTVTSAPRRGAGGGKMALKTGGDHGNRQLRSTTVQLLVPTKQLRLSPRFATR